MKSNPARVSRLIYSVMLVVLLTGCAARRSSPPLTPEQGVGRALRLLDASLEASTEFYSTQKQACRESSEACRLSASALEKLRAQLEKANTAFLLAVEAYKSWRAATGLPAQAGTEQAARDSLAFAQGEHQLAEEIADAESQ